MAEINGQMIRIFTAVNFLCFLPVFIRCCLNVKKNGETFGFYKKMSYRNSNSF